MTLPVTPADIDAAAARIAPYVRRTPLLEVAPGTYGPHGPLSLKLEFLQHAGSFKTRGAFNNLLSRKAPAAGVTAASGGNHGIAVALAAQRLGLKARIFVPAISAPAKVAAIRAQGAELIVEGGCYADALKLCEAYAHASGALAVHAFDAIETLAGQGTAAREWEAQIAREGTRPLDSVLVATGGGGLVAGMAAWWRGTVRTIAVEPEGSRALHAALAAGHPVDVEVKSIAADSLGARRAGVLVTQIARAAVDHVALVADDAIRAAQQLLWRDFRIVAEPGGAAAFAALLSGAYKPAQGERLGILLCGGNTDPGSVAIA